MDSEIFTSSNNRARKCLGFFVKKPHDLLRWWSSAAQFSEKAPQKIGFIKFLATFAVRNCL